MIGIVLVSHSEPLANATLELALQMVHGEMPPLRVAAGAEGTFGTDAAAIAAAIDELSSADGVLVITDLGSAVLSSSLALDLRESTHPVIISDGPFVEATTAAVVSAAAGASLASVAFEASAALDAKRSTGGFDASPPAGPDESATDANEPTSAPDDEATAEEVILNPMGIHARPAAVLVRLAAEYDAKIQLRNLTSGRGPVSAASLVGMLSLALGRGDRLGISATGPDARRAIASLAALVQDGFGELE